jgi:hypothetical protein
LVACDVVAYPELASECSFLSDVSQVAPDAGLDSTDGGAESGAADPAIADAAAESSTE